MSMFLHLVACAAICSGAIAQPEETSDDGNRAPLKSSVFLAPDRFETVPGADMAVRMTIGDPEAAEPAPWLETDWLFVRGGGWQWNVSATPGGEETAGDEAPDLPMPEHGAAMIGADFAPARETWTGEELEGFFAAHGGASFDVERFGGRDDIRVERRRSAVAIVRVLDGVTEGLPSPPAMTKAGLTSEIRLDDDPTVLSPGDTLRVRLYAGYHSRKGVAVFAQGEGGGEGGELIAVPVDGFGRCEVPIDRPGPWRLEFHYAELAGKPGAAPIGETVGEQAEGAGEDTQPPEITLYTATLTFHIGGEP